MECKINKMYLLKWNDLILEGSSADIECDIEDIEKKVSQKNSLFYTGKLSVGEMVIKNNMLEDIKKAVCAPLMMAQDNYQSVMKKYGIVLEELEEELANVNVMEGIQVKNHVNPSVQKESLSIQRLAQMELF